MRQRKNPHGFSLIELMLAGALFTIFAWGAVGVLLSGLETNRLGEATTVATAYANEGLEAVRSIKVRNFNDLVNTDASGVARESGEWVFLGTDNTSGEYTRVIEVADVDRDGDGNIDENNGDVDLDTKKVTVTVSFDVTPTRPNSVVVETYLTRFDQ